MPEQPGDVDRTCANIEKARKLLNYQPKVPFEEGIARTTEWYRQAYSEGFFSPTPAADSEPITATSSSTNQNDKDGFAVPPLPRLKRDRSDLELSSFVQKAPRQFKRRTHVYISSEPPDSVPGTPRQNLQ